MRWMIGLGLLAFGIRLAWVLSVQRDLFPVNDSLFYHSVGDALANGQGFQLADGSDTAGWPPIYPFIVSVLYRAFGTEPIAGEVFNAFVGAATVPLLYFVARRALGRGEAVFAGLFLALLPGQFFFTDVLLTETLAAFMVVAFFALLVALPDTRRSWAVFGVAAAIAALTRAEGFMLLAVPIAIGWSRLERRELFVRTAIAGCAMVICIAPWTVRNAVVMDAFIPVSNNFGGTLWAGHSEQATGGPMAPPEELTASAERLEGPARENERGRILRDEAVEWALDHPLEDLALIPGKLAFLARGNSAALDWWVDPQNPRIMGDQARFRWGVLADAAWFGLFALFLTSIAVFGRALWRNRFLLGAITYIGVIVVLYGFVFVGDYRYRAPVEPLMILIAAPLVARLGTLRRRAGLPGEA